MSCTVNVIVYCCYQAEVVNKVLGVLYGARTQEAVHQVNNPLPGPKFPISEGRCNVSICVFGPFHRFWSH